MAQESYPISSISIPVVTSENTILNPGFLRCRLVTSFYWALPLWTIALDPTFGSFTFIKTGFTLGEPVLLAGPACLCCLV